MKRADVWAISTRKGGVLKTTIAVNMAGVLAKEGKKVLIVDMDSQGNVLVSFGKNPDKIKYSTYDVLMGNLQGDDIEKAFISVHKNIDVLSANDDMLDFDFEVIPNKERFPRPFNLLKESMSHFLYDYDVIIIDTPPNFGLIQGNALMFANRVIVPFQPESYSMRALVKIIESVDHFAKQYNKDLQLLGIVATLVDMRTSLHCEIMESVRKFCRKNDIPLMHTIIPKSIRYAASISYQKKPMTLAKPNHQLSEHFFELYEEVQYYVN